MGQPDPQRASPDAHMKPRRLLPFQLTGGPAQLVSFGSVPV